MFAAFSLGKSVKNYQAGGGGTPQAEKFFGLVPYWGPANFKQGSDGRLGSVYHRLCGRGQHYMPYSGNPHSHAL